MMVKREGATVFYLGYGVSSMEFPNEAMEFVIGWSFRIWGIRVGVTNELNYSPILQVLGVYDDQASRCHRFLSEYEVAWLRVDTQTILTIAKHVITKNHRIGVSHTEPKTWHLNIRNVEESDRGAYMCQINTDPMKSQIGYLEVVENILIKKKKLTKNYNNYILFWQYERFHCLILSLSLSLSRYLYVTLNNVTSKNYSNNFQNLKIQFVICVNSVVHSLKLVNNINILVISPNILDYMTSTDMIVREGSNVTLRCAAKGFPTPNITWRREDGETIRTGYGDEVRFVEGSVFNITKINRSQMGAYLCIASNGVPPTVISPMISIQNQLVGAQEGQRMTLECNSEAFPESINYWTRENKEITKNGSAITILYLWQSKEKLKNSEPSPCILLKSREKYNQSFTNNEYKVHMKLTILSVEMSDYGTYKCISKNALGETDGSIKLYHIPTPTTQPRTTTTTPVPTSEEVENIQNSRQRPLPSVQPSPHQITDSSLPNIGRTDDIRLRGRASSGSYNDAENAIATKGRASIDSEVRPRRIDNTAQSMSSRGSSSNFLLQSTAAICIILLSALS
ncbi:Lachesin [Eufriesea mexicana]|uniref:Lachesin n=1 Tax=Eufriesea mexicana TaxID=516756 RepID=A0A310SIS6_9HYME|nr:Lachesin [Eufriesea mexicana]